LPDSGALHADVDGDGHRDSIDIGVRRSAPAPCRFLLRVRFARTVRVASLRQEEAERYWPVARIPRVLRAVAINRAPGREIAVAVDAGASTETIALFAWHAPDLVRMKIRGGLAADGFIDGGSLAGSFAVDCLAPGRVVQDSIRGASDRGRFVLRRQVYRVGPLTLTLASQHKFGVTPAQLKRLAGAAGPFGSCG
jgi:hypothetical protein